MSLRRADEDLPGVAGEWVFTAGVTVAALAALVFCAVAALVTSPGSRNAGGTLPVGSDASSC